MNSDHAPGREVLQHWFRQATDEGYAIPCLCYSDIWDLKAIVEAARLEDAPVMIASNPLVVGAIGIDILEAIEIALTHKESNIIRHLDHSMSADLCKRAVDAGYQSVMIDGSSLSLAENIELTRCVVEYAHKYGVFVEGELGRIKGQGIEGVYNGDDFLANVNDAICFVRETDVDALAIGVGTAHGFYTERPKIDFERLKEIHAVVDVPLVLHGGTGIPEEDISRAIREGIRKINIGTIIYSTYMNALREELTRRPPSPYTIFVMEAVQPKIVEIARQSIRTLGASERREKGLARSAF